MNQHIAETKMSHLGNVASKRFGHRHEFALERSEHQDHGDTGESGRSHGVNQEGEQGNDLEHT